MFQASRRFGPLCCQLRKIIAVKNTQICIEPTAYKMSNTNVMAVPCRSFTYENINWDDWVVDYEQMKKAVNDEKFLIIDVREPYEVEKHGKIPNSLNIPVDNVKAALSLPYDKFKETYKRSPPSDDTTIIFYCLLGKRSGMVQDDVMEMGYKNVKNYMGGWFDWAKKSNEEQQKKNVKNYVYGWFDWARKSKEEQQKKSKEFVM